MYCQQLNFEPERDRPVIDRVHLHAGTEYTGLHFSTVCPQVARETIKQLGGERELGHEQHLALHVHDALVHAPGAVAEHPVGEDFLAHAGERVLIVFALHGRVDQQARTDVGHGLLIDGNAGCLYTLEQGDHGGVKCVPGMTRTKGPAL